jgi:hypothetical protein
MQAVRRISLKRLSKGKQKMDRICGTPGVDNERVEMLTISYRLNV